MPRQEWVLSRACGPCARRAQQAALEDGTAELARSEKAKATLAAVEKALSLSHLVGLEPRLALQECHAKLAAVRDCPVPKPTMFAEPTITAGRWDLPAAYDPQRQSPFGGGESSYWTGRGLFAARLSSPSALPPPACGAARWPLPLTAGARSTRHGGRRSGGRQKQSRAGLAAANAAAGYAKAARSAGVARDAMPASTCLLRHGPPPPLRGCAAGSAPPAAPAAQLVGPLGAPPKPVVSAQFADGWAKATDSATDSAEHPGFSYGAWPLDLAYPGRRPAPGRAPWLVPSSLWPLAEDPLEAAPSWLVDELPPPSWAQDVEGRLREAEQRGGSENAYFAALLEEPLVGWAPQEGELDAERPSEGAADPQGWLDDMETDSQPTESQPTGSLAVGVSNRCSRQHGSRSCCGGGAAAVGGRAALPAPMTPDNCEEVLEISAAAPPILKEVQEISAAEFAAATELTRKKRRQAAWAARLATPAAESLCGVRVPLPAVAAAAPLEVTASGAALAAEAAAAVAVEAAAAEARLRRSAALREAVSARARLADAWVAMAMAAASYTDTRLATLRRSEEVEAAIFEAKKRVKILEKALDDSRPEPPVAAAGGVVAADAAAVV